MLLLGGVVKILIVGSRGITNFDLSAYVSGEVRLIISGGASGVDAIAEKYADERKISKLILRPEYSRYGRRAPLLRNEKMVDLADEVLVIWDGVSRGTAYTIECAKKKGKSLKVITV